MTGFEDLPVELLYDIHLTSLSSALPVLSRYLRQVFTATSPYHRARYLYLRHDRKTLAHAVKYGICNLDVVHALEKQASARGKKLKCPQLPRRLVKGVGRIAGKDPTEVDMPFIAYLLDRYSASPNSHDGYPLARAVFARHLPLIRLLLAHGADPGLKDGWAVTTAISHGDFDLVKLLMEPGSERTDEPLSDDVVLVAKGSRTAQKRRRDSDGGGGKRRKMEDRCAATSIMLETAVKSKQWAIVDYLTAKGPAQAGYLTQILLYGIFLALFLNCYTSGELASTGLLGRTALTLSLTLNTAYTGLCFYEAFISSVWQNRTWAFLSNGDLPWNALPLLGGLIAVVTEVALAYRAGKLLPCAWARIVFGVWMVLLILAVLTGSILACLAGIFYHHQDVFIMHWASSAAVWLWSSAIADVSISVAAAYSLKSRIAGFNRETDSVLCTLIFIVLRTAAYTAIISIVVAAVESVYKDYQLQSFVTAALWLPLGALYGIALFTFSVSKWTTSHHTITVPTLSRLSRARSSEGSTPRTPLIVTVHQQREVRIDEDNENPLNKQRPRRGSRKDHCVTSPV
ncbi:hypothetical protein B0A53_04817 [Rhodotorula sp. CCFEE 5036]|nr:hypothetical protein B0A53_04817 [Rhodotorula sp. CCFEE 5036]